MKITAQQLTTEQKLRLLIGKDNWSTCDFGGALPFLRVTDASMGVRMPTDSDKWDGDRPSVAYPSSQMLANTWNLDIVHEYAQCVADDCLDYGADILLGPGVNIKRSPLCGRNFEYNRKLQSSEVDERTLREIYYKPFEIACEAKPVSVMCSYNKINGVQASEYKMGFDILRNEYGFNGIVISDWDAVYDRTKACKAGLDLEMPVNEEHYKAFVADYKAGKVTNEELDACVQRLLDVICRCKQMREDKKPLHSVEERIAFTQKVEEEGIVLLKNDGVLPLKKGMRVSVCGLYAAPETHGRNNIHLALGGGSGCVRRLTPAYHIPKLLEDVLESAVEFEPAFGDNGVDNAFMNPGLAVDNAAQSDVNLVFAGTGAGIECEGGDRTCMRLAPVQERAILDSASVNRNTVVVLFAGAPIDMSAWINEVAAVLYVGFPGEKGGEAIVNVLTGRVNPSGKLTETFPMHYDDTPAAQGYIDGKVTRYEEGLDVGYRFYDTYNVDVLFPFGYGLSYSEFEYCNLMLKKKEDGIAVSFEIENLSETDGKEVSQVYVRACSSYVYRPYKELKGFAKTFVKAGKKQKTTVTLTKRAFEYWSSGKDCWDMEDGIYEIIVGSSVEENRLSAKVKLSNGEITVL